MSFSFLGFDLAGTIDRRLWWGLLWGTLGACLDALPWGMLVALPLMMADNTDGAQALWILGGIGCVGFFLGAVVKSLALNSNFAATYGMVAEARLRLADHLAKIPLGRVLRWRDGSIAELLTSKFGLYQDIMTHVWGLLVAGTAFPIVLWVMLLFLDWRLALVQLAFVPLAAMAIPWSYRLLDAAAARVAAIHDQVVAGIIEVTGGAKDLSFFDPENRRRATVHKDIDGLRRASLATEVAPAPALACYALILNLGMAGVMVLAAHWFKGGSLEPMTVCLFLFISLRLTSALAELGMFLAELRFARSILRDIRTLADEPRLPCPQDGAGEVPQGAEVEFERVTFSHGGDAVLRDVSAVLKPGTVTALVGPSGAGKTTLAHLLARLWDVQAGTVRIGGVDIRQMDDALLNQTVSMVLQDVTLFEMSIVDNIRLGRPQASEAEVIEVAHAACIHDRIMALPLGYQTVYSERGVRLSGGEKQRIAIARALLKGAPILILDEATASIDLDSEAHVQHALSRLCQGRTVLVIAHRLWTVRSAEQILVLDQGAIVERGTHVSLQKVPGLYARLWERQMTIC